ncbi:MAG: restriction endonuclease subunit S [Corynebacterium sp.]|uniref:restriction endonuclease subunit S n=1 Tax=Corynebacterium sp. TaxID=1720 RepID=UPI0026DB914A|nr:restriction endonuclease subunit S [Corynebacterium sp.]MDO5029956.1 restriction endonuclease subunit S [Corynebacterium sp.]
MSKWPMVKLGEICEIRIGKTPARKNKDFWGQGLPWLSIKDMNQGRVIRKTSEEISAFAVQSLKITPYPPGTVFFSFKLSIGKVGISEVEMFTNEAIAAVTPCDSSILSRGYLMEALENAGKRLQGNDAAMGVTLNKKSLHEIEIPLPPLEEQKRIAGILEASARKYSYAQEQVRTVRGLKRACIDKVIRQETTDSVLLSEVAEISSGITKGRKTKPEETTYEFPYLAVANVKDGFLDLSQVKKIAVTEAETARFALQSGDILLTEGGDPDKLGRGTIWRDEIPGTIHQNHIFRVRLAEESQWTPEALMAVLSFEEARAYFLKSAKQTTGIATLSKTQLSRTPIRKLNSKSARQISELTEFFQRQEQYLARKVGLLQELHQSLAARAFAGEL